MTTKDERERAERYARTYDIRELAEMCVEAERRGDAAKSASQVRAAEKAAYLRGAERAAMIASEMYDGCSTHKYRIDDCVLSKMNLRSGTPRKNLRRVVVK